jgi:hypothetical protein
MFMEPLPGVAGYCDQNRLNQGRAGPANAGCMIRFFLVRRVAFHDNFMCLVLSWMKPEARSASVFWHSDGDTPYRERQVE